MGPSLVDETADKEATVSSGITQEGKWGQQTVKRARGTGEVKNFWRFFIFSSHSIHSQLPATLPLP